MELSNADGNASTAFSWRSAFVKGGCGVTLSPVLLPLAVVLLPLAVGRDLKIVGVANCIVKENLMMQCVSSHWMVGWEETNVHSKGIICPVIFIRYHNFAIKFHIRWDRSGEMHVTIGVFQVTSQVQIWIKDWNLNRESIGNIFAVFVINKNEYKMFITWEQKNSLYFFYKHSMIKYKSDYFHV